MTGLVHRGLAGQIVDMLRERILTGELPSGARLNEVETARDLGTSRGPLREAMGQLVSEGLLVHVPNKGAVVYAARPDDVIALFELRSALECAAARLAAHRRTPGEVTRMRKVCERSRTAHATGRKLPYALDLDFHRSLLQAAHSPRIAEQVGLVQQQVIVLRSGLTSHTAHTETSLGDHEAMAQAVAAGDADLAENLMAAHLALVETELLQSLRAQEDAAPPGAPRAKDGGAPRTGRTAR
ncbi:GntR family transcriptional regulator [Streptomyces sp. VRA16 Mangrove soil]|uniref:GntR family transcriptional regulator n=1 Tax=Streptomyces sp. VRA16 Mangrove soil TaxID=2817434 RepID=UPI001A9FDC6B|nr:GntR family transcriptional regulator [Streptomyces sp. VRA16 Mangrove soil]MBO1334525.1 GntR family transcriptional regulator [Streptomyces sp. VRA16 Mangrove soil]